MEVDRKWSGSHLAICLFLVSTVSAAGQMINPPRLPSQFNVERESATHLTAALMAKSIAPGARYETGLLVFERVIEQIPAAARSRIVWQLRIVEGGQLNAYSSPDGAVYVESGLAQLAGQSAGLWAAILSHEVAHVIRRDWERRDLYQKSLENSRAGNIVLGDPGLPSASWSDSEKASADLGRFCRQMELDADREGLMLMSRAGYHPDFVPALHHMLHARGGSDNASIYDMHPCWEERDQELSRAYTEASIDFEHRWPEWYATPGGNPPVVVFADQPSVKKIASQQWQMVIAMRCQNLAGAVEVVLRAESAHERGARLQRLPDDSGNEFEVRQLTGCTSPKTTVVFTLAGINAKPGTRWTDVYVIDSWGAVLARADFPKLPR